MSKQLKRILELARVLRRNHRPVTLAELSRLGSFSQVSQRTLLRDLNLLMESRLTNLACDTSQIPYQWSLTSCPGLLGLSDQEILSLVLMQRYLGKVLPPDVLSYFRDGFDTATRKMEQGTCDKRYSAWVDKVRIVNHGSSPDSGPEEGVFEILSAALFEEQQTGLTYRTRSGLIRTFDCRMPIDPLALIYRGDDRFLLASADCYPTPFLMSLRQIHAVKVMVTSCSIPKHFRVDHFVSPENFTALLLDRLLEEEAGRSEITLQKAA